MTLVGWRKYSLAAGALLGSFILALTGKLTSDFATVAAVVVGSFNAAHAVQDWSHHAAVSPENAPEDGNGPVTP